MCGIIGVIDKRRQCMDGSSIRNSLAMMNERGNGEGAGYVAYGIYPDFADAYALHVFFNNVTENKPLLDRELEKRYGQPQYRDTKGRIARAGFCETGGGTLLS